MRYMMFFFQDGSNGLYQPPELADARRILSIKKTCQHE
jgi:hypothetical protein